MIDKQFPLNDKSISYMRKLIEHYLNKQKIVAIAMLDIHPSPLLLNGNTHIMGIEIMPYIKRYRKKTTLPQRGIWRGKWQFYWHGHGCRLTHIDTGEPIEWDGPDLNIFDAGWFFTHLEWRIKKSVTTTNQKQYMTWMNTIFNHMEISEEIIHSSLNNGWMLSS